MSYITKTRLHQLVLDARANGPSDELIKAITNIAKGRVRRAGSKEDLSDYVQDALIQVLANLHTLDVSKNCFSYITQMCWTVFLSYKRKEKNERKKLTRFADRLRRSNYL